MACAIEIVQPCHDALGRADVPGLLATLNDNVERSEAERVPF